MIKVVTFTNRRDAEVCRAEIDEFLRDKGSITVAECLEVVDRGGYKSLHSRIYLGDFDPERYGWGSESIVEIDSTGYEYEGHVDLAWHDVNISDEFCVITKWRESERLRRE